MLVVKSGMFLVLRSGPVNVDFNRAALLMTHTYVCFIYVHVVNVVIMLLFHAFSFYFKMFKLCNSLTCTTKPASSWPPAREGVHRVKFKSFDVRCCCQAKYDSSGT